MSDISIDVLHQFHGLQKNCTAEQLLKIKEALGITQEDEERLKGLQAEDEFLVLIYSLERVKNFAGVDENYAQITHSKTGDLFVETTDNRKLCIEIKSTKNDYKEFTRKSILDKKEFADSHSHECYFAIKLKGIWILLNADYILAHNCKITLLNDFPASEMADVFGERYFLFPKGLQVLTTYSKTHNNEGGVSGIQLDFGNATRIRLKYNKTILQTYTINNEKKPTLSFILEAIEDAMASQSVQTCPINEDQTVVIETLTSNTIVTFSQILTAPIVHLLNPKGENNETFTYSTYIDELKNQRSIYTNFNRELVLNLLYDGLYPKYKVYMSEDNQKFYGLQDWLTNK